MATDADLHKLRKDELLELAREIGLEVDPSTLKDDILAAIEDELAARGAQFEPTDLGLEPDPDAEPEPIVTDDMLAKAKRDAEVTAAVDDEGAVAVTFTGPFAVFLPHVNAVRTTDLVIDGELVIAAGDPADHIASGDTVRVAHDDAINLCDQVDTWSLASPKGDA